MHKKELTPNLFENKKILAMSDTGYPYQYIRDFCQKIETAIVDVYVSPATTARFLKLYIAATGNKRCKILKDKNYQLFDKIQKTDYIFVVFFGKKVSRETRALTVLCQSLVIQGYDLITVTEEGVDYDDNSSIFGL